MKLTVYTLLISAFLLGCIRETDKLPIYSPKIRNFRFIDQDSQWITNETFINSIYVADFIYLNCTVCSPHMTKQMLRLYKRYEGDNRIKFLSHSIDVKNDTVPKLKKYAKALEANSGNWHFVTGDKYKIFAIADDYVSTVKENSNGTLDHSCRFMLVDIRGHIRSVCDGTNSKAVDQFMSDIDKLLIEEFGYFIQDDWSKIHPDEPIIKRVNEKRLALIIGNADYQNGQDLKNPINDAVLIENTLKNLGFDIMKLTNADKKEMESVIKKFGKKFKDYNILLFYYAGHGIQVDGTNYLIPIDAQLNEKYDSEFEAIDVNHIVRGFSRYPNNTNIMILDACRNNPFRSWDRGNGRGFKAISPSSGTIIGFATSEGETASDGHYGENGLYTKELVKQIKIPQPIESVFKKTRIEVEKQSNNAQSPQEWTKLKGDFWFKR